MQPSHHLSTCGRCSNMRPVGPVRSTQGNYDCCSDAQYLSGKQLVTHSMGACYACDMMGVCMHQAFRRSLLVTSGLATQCRLMSYKLERYSYACWKSLGMDT